MSTPTDPYLGNTYKDVVTGFEGVCTGHVVYLTGCDQVLLAGKAKDGKPAESVWIDCQRAKPVEKVKRIVLDNGKTPGSDAPAPIR